MNKNSKKIMPFGRGKFIIYNKPKIPIKKFEWTDDALKRIKNIKQENKLTEINQKYRISMHVHINYLYKYEFNLKITKEKENGWILINTFNESILALHFFKQYISNLYR